MGVEFIEGALVGMTASLGVVAAAIIASARRPVPAVAAVPPTSADSVPYVKAYTNFRSVYDRMPVEDRSAIEQAHNERLVESGSFERPSEPQHDVSGHVDSETTAPEPAIESIPNMYEWPEGEPDAVAEAPAESQAVDPFDRPSTEFVLAEILEPKDLSWVPASARDRFHAGSLPSGTVDFIQTPGGGWEAVQPDLEPVGDEDELVAFRETAEITGMPTPLPAWVQMDTSTWEAIQPSRKALARADAAMRQERRGVVLALPAAPTENASPQRNGGTARKGKRR